MTKLRIYEMTKSDARQSYINEIETFQSEDGSQCKTMIDEVLVRLSSSDYIIQEVSKFVVSEFAAETIRGTSGEIAKIFEHASVEICLM